ncbi:MAG: amidohydrolase family protein [Acidobacteria bacterium]|nr:amidohydrolase family protein [Acidobacteriota bacterium]
MSRRHLVVAACLAGLLVAGGSSALRAAETEAPSRFAVVGVTIHSVSGPTIEGGTLLVTGDTLEAVGADVDVPAGTQVIEFGGRHVYPAFIHPSSTLGLTEVNSVDGTVDTTEVGEVNPALRVESSFHADSRLLPATVAGGVLFAHVVPQGPLLSGTSAVMRLTGWNWHDMTVAAPVAMHLRFPSFIPRPGFFGPPPSQEEVDARRKKDLETLDRTFAGARAYQKARQVMAAGKGPFVALDPSFEALLPVLDGTLPLFLHADHAEQIAAALDWAEEQGLSKLVLVSNQDAAGFAERLAAADIPVLFTGTLRLPREAWDPYDAAYTAPAKLHEAGVRLAIADAGNGFAAFNSRNLPFEAAMAVAFGLPHDVALEAITRVPAELLGVGDRLGTLEAGKEASFVVTDGDPLDIRTHIEAVWNAGVPVDLEADPQRRLWRRYAGRPARETAKPKGPKP